jgi:replication factor C large subunit
MTHHCRNRELTVAMAAAYELDEEHVAFVTGSGKDTNKVASIVEDARRLREEAAVAGSEGAFEGASAEDGAAGTDGAVGAAGERSAADTEDPEDGESGKTAEEGVPAGEGADDEQSGLSDFM